MRKVYLNRLKGKIAKQNGRLTQHKRFVPYGTYPNSAFSGTSFMLETLYETGLFSSELMRTLIDRGSAYA